MAISRTITGTVYFANYPYSQFAKIYVTPPGGTEQDTGIVVTAPSGTGSGTFTYIATSLGLWSFRAEAYSGSNILGGSGNQSITVVAIVAPAPINLTVVQADDLEAIVGEFDFDTSDLPQWAKVYYRVDGTVPWIDSGLTVYPDGSDQGHFQIVVAPEDYEVKVTSQNEEGVGTDSSVEDVTITSVDVANLTVEEGDALKDEVVTVVDTITIRGGRATQLSAGNVSVSTSTALLPSEWVYALYNGALARNPTGGELTADLAALGAVDTDGQAYLTELQNQASDIFNSAEYIGLGRTDVQFISDLYEGMLGRFSDDEGHAFWLAQLATQGGTQTRAQVITSFTGSREFTYRAFCLFGWVPSASSSGGNYDDILVAPEDLTILIDPETFNVLTSEA